jgi:hypothetical protein
MSSFTDKVFSAFLETIGARTSFPELRSCVMTAVWQDVPYEEARDETLTTCRLKFQDNATRRMFEEHLKTLWDDLLTHRQEDKPFLLSTLDPPKDPKGLQAQLNLRKNEVQNFAPLFKSASIPSELMEDFRDAVDFAKIAEEKWSVALHSAQTIQAGQMFNDLLEQTKKADTLYEKNINRLGRLWFKARSGSPS